MARFTKTPRYHQTVTAKCYGEVEGFAVANRLSVAVFVYSRRAGRNLQACLAAQGLREKLQASKRCAW
ncbi:MAG: hypothetical protein DKT66_07860 [Candidatus Melainabacteria bacterium]|nr:MAG: hypothetical protein DKT66_07860 [Candidatus Melainabacteria bacterium]